MHSLSSQRQMGSIVVNIDLIWLQTSPFFTTYNLSLI